MKEEDKSDIDKEDVNEKDAERLSVKLRKWGRKMKRVFRGLEYYFWRATRLNGKSSVH